MVSEPAAATRPRLLFLSQTLPYPPHGGVEARTYNILKLLAREYDVTALCFFRRGGAVQGRVQEAIEALRPFGTVEAFSIPQEWSRLRLARDHLCSILSGRVYTVSAYESAAFVRRLRELLQSERYEMVHADSMDLSGYFAEVKPLPLVCVHHNVESDLLRRRASVRRNPLVAAYLRLQAALMEREERRVTPQVALNVAVSPADAARFAVIAPTARFTVVPNGVDVDAFRPAAGNPNPNEVVFLGGTSWFPNLDGMIWFLREALPTLRTLVPSVSVTWVGKATTQQRAQFESEYGIRMTGYVPSVEPYVSVASCFIAPLRFGGGTRLKILDGWAMGQAVVSTTVGCEGLDARDGENILVRDKPAEFASAIAEILLSAETRIRLGREARRTVETLYAWEMIGRGMLATYRDVLTASP